MPNSTPRLPSRFGRPLQSVAAQDGWKTPFFGALVDYAERGNQLWTCPGHNGGIFYNRSPIGRIFVEHLGEAVFRVGHAWRRWGTRRIWSRRGSLEAAIWSKRRPVIVVPLIQK